MDENGSPRPPVSFWIISGSSLLWNAFGGFNYTMTQIRDADFLKDVPAPVIQAIDAAPFWATSAWALGVWASLAGSLLLLLRTRFAIHAFALSMIAAAVSFAWQFSVGIVANPVLPIVILGVVALLLWYAAQQRNLGRLR